VLGYRYIPGLRARVEHEGGGYLLRTNADGFRCAHELPPTRLGGSRARILLFGDSFTAGTGVSDSRRYGELLERWTGGGTEIINLAIAGHGLDQQLLVAETVAAGIPRDLAIIGLWTDTIRRVVARYGLVQAADGSLWARPKPWFVFEEDGALTLHGVPVPPDPLPLSALRPAELAHVPVAAERHTQVEAYERDDDPGRLLLRAIAERFVRALDCRVIVLLLPPYRHVEELADASPAHAEFARLNRMPGVTVHDPLPDLRALGSADRRRLRFPNDYHPTAEYHRIVAESVLSVVTAGLVAPLPGPGQRNADR
jgi:hypothetical protein